MNKKNNKKKGDYAETLAADYLKSRGLRIIARNYRKKTGEIDIVYTEDNTIVFAEVKFRVAVAYGSPAEAVGKQKQWRILKTSLFFLQERDLFDRDIRYDVIEVGENGVLNHIEGAFTAQAIR